jgi:hypothetical protein
MGVFESFELRMGMGRSWAILVLSLTFVPRVHAARITIDQNRTIDAANSIFLDPLDVSGIDIGEWDDFENIHPGSVEIVTGLLPPTQVSVIEEGVIERVVNVRDGSLLDLKGGKLAGNINGRGDGHIEMSSGQIGSRLRLHDRSTANLAGGAIAGFGFDVIATRDFSHLTLARASVTNTGGSIAIHASDSSQVSIGSGRVEGSYPAAIVGDGNSSIEIANGSIMGGGQDGILLSQNSALQVNGGTITGIDDGVEIHESATVSISDGSVTGTTAGISAYDLSQVIVNGGQISGRRTLQSAGWATIHILGGTFDGSTSLFAGDDSSVHIAGGALNSIRLQGRSTLNVSGGSIGRVSARPENSVNVFYRQVGELRELIHGGSAEFSVNRPATYYDSVDADTIIDHDIGTRGLGVVNGSAGPTRVSIAEGALIRGLGVYATGDSHVEMTGGEIRDVTTGIHVHDATSLVVSAGRINASTGGIVAGVRADVSISAGTIEGAQYGLHAAGLATISLAGGQIRGVGGDAITASELSRVFVRGGEARGAEHGVRLTGQSKLLILDGLISGNTAGVATFDNTAAIMTGGTIESNNDGLTVFGNSQIEIVQGTIGGQSAGLRVHESGRVNMSGGTVNNGVSLDGQSRLFLAEGSINGNVTLTDTSRVDLSGGRIAGKLLGMSGSRLLITDGSVRDGLHLLGTSEGELMGGLIGGAVVVEESAILRVYGKGLQLSDTNVTGTFLDGTAVDLAVTAPAPDRVRLYETLRDDTTIDAGTQIPSHIAVLDHQGQPAHVDVRNGAKIPGDLYVAGSSQVDIYGGVLEGDLVAVEAGTINVYGTGLNFSGSRIRGRLLDGTRINRPVRISDGARIVPFRVLSQSQEIAGGTDSSLAIIGTPESPVSVTFRDAYVAGEVSARGSSISDFGLGSIDGAMGITAADDSVVNISGTSVNAYVGNGIRIRDAGTVYVEFGWVNGSQHGISASDQSTLRILDGNLIGQTRNGVALDGRAGAVISGGLIRGATSGVEAAGSSRVDVVDGWIVAAEDGITTLDGGRVAIRSGTIIGQEHGVMARDHSEVDIYGGTMGGEQALVVGDSATVNVFGGRFNQELLVAGGTLNVYGTKLKLDGSRLTGFLVDGRRLDHEVSISGEGRILLHEDGPLHPGDFDGSYRLDLPDVQSLEAALRNGSPAAAFDLNVSGKVEPADLSYLLFSWIEVAVGDSNVDGQFNSSDLVTAFAAGEYEDSVELNSLWTSGDWNGDREFDSQDLVFAFQMGDYESSASGDLATVPEPTTRGMVLLGAFLVQRRRTRLLKQGPAPQTPAI